MAECRNQHAAYAISKAMDAIWRVVADANRYFAGQEPWALKKTDPARMETVLWTTAEVLRIVGLLIQPYVPASSAKLLDLAGRAPDGTQFCRDRQPPGFRHALASTAASIPALC